MARSENNLTTKGHLPRDAAGTHPSDAESFVTVLNRRNRLISFRVSEDEFDRYTRLCEAEGARSISDLARTAVNRMLLMSEAVSPDAPRGIQTLDEVTRSLHANLALISGLLREYNAMPVAPPPPQEEHEKK